MRKFAFLNNLLLLLVFLLPLQTRYIVSRTPLGVGTSEYGTISFYAVEVFLWFVFILFLLAGRLNIPPERSSRRLALVILAFVLYSLLGIFSNPSYLRGFFAWFRLLEGAALFALLAWGGVKNKWLVSSFILGAVAQAAIGIAQFSIQGVSPSTLLGIARHDPSFLGDAVVETVSGRWLRAYGFLPHPNILGGYLSLALLLLFDLAFWKRKPSRAETGIIFGILLISAALFFTFSRGAWIAFGSGALILVWNIFLRNGDERFHGALRFGLPAALLWLVLGLTFVPLLQTRFSGLVARQDEAVRLEELSRSERISGYGDAFQILPKYFLTGTGLGAYIKSVEKLRPGLAGYAYQPAHNAYLLLTLELGVPAFFLFGGMLFLFFLALLRNGREGAVPAFVALFVLGLFDHYLWSLEAGIMLFWAALGLLYNFKADEPTINTP